MLVAYVSAKVPGVVFGLSSVAVILISLIVHEFGHALMARAFKLRPVVLLHGWGGLCAHASPRSARDDSLIIAAGPGAGLLFGGLIWGGWLLLNSTLGDAWHADLPYLSFFLDRLIDWNIYWSLINLLPMYPLDGGQLFQIWAHKKFPAQQAHTYTHYLAIALAIVGIVMASNRQSTLLMLICAFIVIENIRRLQMGPQFHYNERTAGAPTVTQGAGFLGSLKPEPVIAKLMVATAGIWALFVLGITVLDQRWATDAFSWLRLQPTEAVAGFKFWQLVSYMWLHDLTSLSHIIGNIFGLWLLGNIMARRWGAKDFIYFYVWSGLGAAVFSVACGHIFPETFGTAIVGASGSIMGLVAALSFTLRDETLGMFFTVPIKAKYILPLVLGVDALMFLSGNASDVAVQTHLGGAFTGWLLMTGNWRPGVAMDRFRLWRIRRGRRKPALKRAPHLRVIEGGKDKTDDDEWLH